MNLIFNPMMPKHYENFWQILIFLDALFNMLLEAALFQKTAMMAVSLSGCPTSLC
jgi:hypothetical protein